MRVAVLMAEMCSSTSVAASLETLKCANLFHWQHTGDPTPLFETCTVSLDGRPVSSSGDLLLTPEKRLADIEEADLIVVPGFLFNTKPAIESFQAFAPWLRHHHQRGAAIAAICTGAFMVAEAGLLDNTVATTHWAYVNLFTRRYPDVLLQPRHIVTEDKGIICSGGASSAIDLLLHIIRRFATPEIAAECSKKLLVDTSRRDQAPYVMLLFRKNHKDDNILRVQEWLEQHFAQPIVIDDLAAQFGFGVRNFKRRFKEATNQTPLNYLQCVRIENAKRLIETTRRNIDSITCEVGYEDSNSFRRLFSERVGLSPTAYRKKFQPLQIEKTNALIKRSSS